MKGMKTGVAGDNCVVLEGELTNLIAMYVRSPPPAEDAFAMTEKLVSCLQLTPHHNNTIITGDFNARLDKPDPPTCASRSAHEDAPRHHIDAQTERD